MEILVNHEPLDFTLENESSVGEVVDGLSAWLRDGNFAITGLNVDATDYLVGERSTWETINLSDVGRIDVEALPLSNVQRTTLQALDEYLEIVEGCIVSGNASALADATAELPFVRERMGTYFPALIGVDGQAHLLASLSSEIRAVSATAMEAELMEIAALRSLVAARIREFDAPEKELAGTLRALAAALPALQEIPVLLQTGKQKAAMDAVVALTELLDKSVRLTPLVEAANADSSASAAVRTATQQLSPFLVELSGALESGDTVLVGDLLEYEISPILQTLAREA